MGGLGRAGALLPPQAPLLVAAKFNAEELDHSYARLWEVRDCGPIFLGSSQSTHCVWQDSEKRVRCRERQCQRAARQGPALLQPPCDLWGRRG